MRELQSRFGVTGLPVVLLLDEDGDELERIQEFMPTTDLLARLENPGPPRPSQAAAPSAAAPVVKPLPEPKPSPEAKPAPQPKPAPEPTPASKFNPKNI